MTHPKILIAENELDRARSLRSSLEADGFQVLQATDSASAWSILHAQELVMAIIDSRLPGLPTFNLLRRVRTDPDLTRLPVLILGESIASEEAIAWLNLGADDYISRSISSALLKAEVHAKLRRGKPAN